MLKLLLKDVLKSPGKLLALCFVVYLASMSFFVGLLLCAIGARWFHKHLVVKARAIEAAEAEAAPDFAEQAQKAAAQKTSANATSAPTAVAEPATNPQRQYAKSAVVIPLKKTGSTLD